MADIFHEVEEELRRDKYNALLRRYGLWVLAGVVLIVVAAAIHQLVWEPRRLSRIHDASDAYERALTLREAGQTAQADAAFAEIVAGDHSGYAALALMQQAELAEQAGDSARAVALYNQAAERAGDQALGGLARIRALYAMVGTASFEQVLARAEPLAADSSPYRSSARELIAVAALRAGDTARARREYQYLTLAPETPPGVRARASEGLAAITRAEAATPSAEDSPS